MRWAHDKSADDDGMIPVNDGIVSVLFQFHCIENCRSVLVGIPFARWMVAHLILVQQQVTTSCDNDNKRELRFWSPAELPPVIMDSRCWSEYRS